MVFGIGPEECVSNYRTGKAEFNQLCHPVQRNAATFGVCPLLLEMKMQSIINAGSMLCAAAIQSGRCPASGSGNQCEAPERIQEARSSATRRRMARRLRSSRRWIEGRLLMRIASIPLARPDSLDLDNRLRERQRNSGLRLWRHRGPDRRK